MSDIDRHAVVAARHAGERFDRVVAAMFPDFSRTRLAGWIRDGQLTLDGAHRPPRHPVAGGETIHLKAALDAPERWRTAQATVPFRVVFEDDDLLVVDKPAGVVVHPGVGNPDQTLVNGLLAHRPSLDGLKRAGVVHRLDKDTSGLLLVAANSGAATALNRALRRREIGRRYRAVTEGVLTAGCDISAPIGRHPHRRTLQAVVERGKPARTRVRVVTRYRAHTLIEATLDTGRTHQIRVHLASLDHPLVGDTRYGARRRLPPAPDPALIDVVQGFHRQALHAFRLAVAHPRTGAPLEFTAPPPEDFAALAAALAADAAG